MPYNMEWSEIQGWIRKSAQLLIKKLARNDCAWADGAENGHQNGPYIPREIREASFFPPLISSNPEKPHIFGARFHTLWPATGEIRSSALKHYSNKGPETHFTRVPRDEFKNLTPASWLLGGRLRQPEGDVTHWFVAIDSASEEAELLETAFELAADFHAGLFDPLRASGSPTSDVERMIEELAMAVKNGTLLSFIASVAELPAPGVFARNAQAVFLKETGHEQLDPYEIACPGDAIMRISRDIEFALYKRAELRRRSAEAVRVLMESGSDLVTSVVRGFPALDAIFLSASQQRKNRAGLSFEYHVAAMLRGGRVRHEEQKVTGGRRPDFILPSVAELEKRDARPFDAAMVLSLKTTLRERWKQVKLEKFNSALFLATVDDRIPSAAIDDMRANDIHLVVPESLQQSRETCYRGKDNVISFREFFDDEISRRRPFLLLPAVS